MCPAQTAPEHQDRLGKVSASHPVTSAELDRFAPLVGLVPIVASGFAVAYNVGYFLAYDISWLPFFSLSEHVVFALRALPVAIGACAAFLISIMDPPKVLSVWVRWIWGFVLVIASILSFANAHLGLSIVFLMFAYGASRHHRYPSKSLGVTVLYLGTSVMLLSLLVGYTAALARKPIWEFEKYIGVLTHPKLRSILVAPSMCFESGSTLHVGHAIFAGSKGVLFHDYRHHSSYLMRSDEMQNIHNCSPSELDAFIAKAPVD